MNVVNEADKSHRGAALFAWDLFAGGEGWIFCLLYV